MTSIKVNFDCTGQYSTSCRMSGHKDESWLDLQKSPLTSEVLFSQGDTANRTNQVFSEGGFNNFHCFDLRVMRNKWGIWSNWRIDEFLDRFKTGERAFIFLLWDLCCLGFYRWHSRRSFLAFGTSCGNHGWWVGGGLGGIYTAGGTDEWWSQNKKQNFRVWDLPYPWFLAPFKPMSTKFEESPLGLGSIIEHQSLLLFCSHWDDTILLERVSRLLFRIFIFETSTQFKYCWVINMLKSPVRIFHISHMYRDTSSVWQYLSPMFDGIPLRLAS